MTHLYHYSVPVFGKALRGLIICIEKTEAHGIPESDMLATAFASDMFPFVRQVHIASDNAKGAVARITGIENPAFSDTETTYAGLKERIEKTLTFIESVPESAFEGQDERQVTLPYFPGKYMTATDYLRAYVLPNFFFHVTTAYDLMRSKGVPIGKTDFLNGLPLRALD
jgi:uncharacterized protein